eukprot:TRINITY_DN61408_c0_g1_i1.p1 TRINITY_DN61408_c0_g1~~TRINITY_DN61408_c0_g1_i1.p1  ORF type:complete len:408 (+),score=58.27 TRINITY_DN61408_c0_g1_i1:80-1303(+)
MNTSILHFVKYSCAFFLAMGACSSYEVCCSTKKRNASSLGPPAGGHNISLAATELFSVVGCSAYHTSIIVDDMELFFDGGGIVLADAFWSHQWSHGIRSRSPSEATETEVVQLGRTSWQVNFAIDMLGPFFQEGSYDVLRKNCNTFSDAASYLFSKKRLDGRFNRLERWVLALEPVSTDIIRRLLKPPEVSKSDSLGPLSGTETASDQAAVVGPRYEPNPLARDFNLEDVIADIDLADTTQESDRSPSESLLTCCRSNQCCGKVQGSQATAGSEDSQQMPKLNRVWDPIIEHHPMPSLDPFGRNDQVGPVSASPSRIMYDSEDEKVKSGPEIRETDPTSNCRSVTGRGLTSCAQSQLPAVFIKTAAPAPLCANLAEDTIWEADEETSPSDGFDCAGKGLSMREAAGI